MNEELFGKIFVGILCGGVIFIVFLVNILSIKESFQLKKYKDFFDLRDNEYFKEKEKLFDYQNIVEKNKKEINSELEKIKFLPKCADFEKNKVNNKIEELKLSIYIYENFTIPQQEEYCEDLKHSLINYAKDNKVPKKFWEGYTEVD